MSELPYFVTWSRQRGAAPLAIESGTGCQFTTTDGRTWLDFASLVYNANLGHGHQGIIDAVKAQADKLCLSAPNVDYPAKRELAEELLSLAPAGYSRVFFTLGGSEANENALKIARMVTGRYKVVTRYRSYHGATLGALSMTGDYRRPPLEPGIVGAIHAMDCYCDRCPFGQQRDTCNSECAHHIDELIGLEGAATIAAVVLEPVPGANGVLVPKDDYWPIVREACTKHGCLLVADEVLTGFGRTGKWFGFEHFGVEPDMITLGKAVTGGYGVLGAVLVHDRIAKHFDDNFLYAGLTHYAHPLGCAAGLAAIRAYREEDLINRAAAMAPHFLDGARSLKDAFPEHITFQRGIGLLAAFETTLGDAAWQRLTAALDEARLLTHPKGSNRSIILSPPLCISKAEIDDGYNRLHAAFRAAGPQGEA